MPHATKPTQYDIPWRGDLVGDVIGIQAELEDLWVKLSGALARVDEAARRFGRCADCVDDKDEWTALGRRSGLTGLYGTIDDFKSRMEQARDELAEVLEFDRFGERAGR